MSPPDRLTIAQVAFASSVMPSARQTSPSLVMTLSFVRGPNLKRVHLDQSAGIILATQLQMRQNRVVLEYFSTTKRIVTGQQRIQRLFITLLTASKRELSSRGHRIALIENDKFNASAHQLLSAAKAFYLVPNNVDATIITCIQLQSHMFVLLGAVDFFGDGQHARSFSCTWWTVEKQVRHVFRFDKLADCLNDFSVRNDLIKTSGSVLLDEGQALCTMSGAYCSSLRYLINFHLMVKLALMFLIDCLI